MGGTSALRLTTRPFEDEFFLETLGGQLHPGGAAATERLIRAARLPRGARVLDVACGSGASLAILEREGFVAIGVDASRPLLTRSGPARRVQASASEIPLRAGSVDAILCECGLCLFGEKDAALRSFAELLAPDGKLLLSDVTLTRQRPEFECSPAIPLCVAGAEALGAMQARVEAAGFSVDLVEDRTADLALMRAEILSRFDVQGLLAALGPDAEPLASFARALDDAFLAGELGYANLIASKRAGR